MSCPTILLRWILVLLSKQPLVELRLRIGLVPAVVSDTGILSIDRVATGRFESSKSLQGYIVKLDILI